MMQVNDYKLETFPNVTNTDRVIVMREKAERINNSINALTYFASRILQKPEGSLTVRDLKSFEEDRFHTAQAALENAQWPVGFYLSRIEKLEEQVLKLGGNPNA